MKTYTERTKTRFDHQWEIRRVYGLKEFAAVEAELRKWVAARSWTSGDGPKAIFTDAVGWLRKRDVLLPGVTTLGGWSPRYATTRPAACGGFWKAC